MFSLPVVGQLDLNVVVPLVTSTSLGIHLEPHRSHKQATEMTADIGTLTAAGNPTPPESSSGAADDLMSDGSLWFVGFPQASTADHVEALGECMQKVDDYHTWVSSRCGGKPGAIAEDMRTTPWYVIIFIIFSFTTS